MIQGNHNTIGSKLRSYRNRSGLSQLELEIEIDASPGFISRIESGKVNPTKETIAKVIKALDIRGFEAAELYELNLDEIPDIFDSLLLSFSTKDPDQILQNAADILVDKLDFIGIATFRIINDRVYARTYSRIWYANLVDKIIGRPFDSLSISLKDNSNHAIAKTILNKESYHIDSLAQVTSPPLSYRQSKLLEELVKFNSGITFPLSYDDVTFGAIFYARQRRHTFEREERLLSTINNYVALNLYKQYYENRVDLYKKKSKVVK